MDDFEQTQPIGDQIRDLADREGPPPLTPGDLARLDRIDAALREISSGFPVGRLKTRRRPATCVRW